MSECLEETTEFLEKSVSADYKEFEQVRNSTRMMRMYLRAAWRESRHPWRSLQVRSSRSQVL